MEATARWLFLSGSRSRKLIQRWKRYDDVHFHNLLDRANIVSPCLDLNFDHPVLLTSYLFQAYHVLILYSIGYSSSFHFVLFCYFFSPLSLPWFIQVSSFLFLNSKYSWSECYVCKTSLVGWMHYWSYTFYFIYDAPTFKLCYRDSQPAQHVRDSPVTKCQVYHDHRQGGQSSLGTRLSFVSCTLFTISAVVYRFKMIWIQNLCRKVKIDRGEKCWNTEISFILNLGQAIDCCLSRSHNLNKTTIQERNQTR